MIRTDAKLGGKALQAISLIGDPSSLELFKKSKGPRCALRQYAAEGIAGWEMSR